MAIKLGSCDLTLNLIKPFLEREGLMVDFGGSKSHIEYVKGTLKTDSRSINPGDIFLAYKGVSSDGHLHLKEAIKNGASFLIVEDAQEILNLDSKEIPCWIKVKSGRTAWTALASLAFKHPEKELQILGATGTNGKTSTVWMTSEILRSSGIPCLAIGTLGAKLFDETLPINHTTPDPDILFGLLALARDSGVKVVVMEVSSHALAQDKVRGITFSGAAFTSFSRDHLDFHQTMESYWNEKWKLFTNHTSSESLCVFSNGLPYLDLSGLSRRKFLYGYKESFPDNPNLEAKIFAIRSSTYSPLSSIVGFDLDDFSLSAQVPFFAKHAIENLAAASLLASAVLKSLPPSEVLEQVRPVPGRLETIALKDRPHVVIDYAHTPDALAKTLEVLRSASRGKIVAVFGCGGNRDRGKRPLMGQIAEKKADIVIITNDNPRFEDPQTIIKEILSGMNNPLSAHTILDRREAISRALSLATKEDIVLIAGKGHEKYQIIGNSVLPFDDREIALYMLKSKEEQNDNMEELSRLDGPSSPH